MIRSSHGSWNGVYAKREGSGPPVLLLHGFPETHVMWGDVSNALATDFTVVSADLPGYGQSVCPPSDEKHIHYSKRVMAATLRSAMSELGFDRFAVVGHDRGGRVAYRMALDWPECVTHVAVLDVIPTAEVWERADARLMLSFWPFTLLAQPAPLPEMLIAGSPEAVIDDALSNWGTPQSTFSAETRDAYVDALKDPRHVHAICEEYRAAASVDLEHDKADLAAGRKISCPLLVLWSENGGLASWYGQDGGPLGIWRLWAQSVTGGPVPGGHFFAEEHPQQIASRIRSLLSIQSIILP